MGEKTRSEKYTYSDGTDGDGSLTQLKTGSGHKINYTYDALKHLKNASVVNSSNVELFKTACSYRTVSGNQSSAQVEFRNVRRSSDNELLEGKKYDYDSVGNIIQISQSTGDYYPLVKYEYDSQNQLISEIYYDGEGSANTNITSAYYYTYDTAGNLQRVEEGAVGTDGTITKTVIQTYTYSTGGWKDLLTKVNSNPIAYEGQTYDADANTVSGTAISGNPTNYPINGTIYDLAWENGRQLSSISKANRLSPGGRWTVSFEYDSDGIRTKKQVPHGRIYMVYSYITQNGKVVRQSDNRGDAAKVLDFIYDESDRPFALIYTNGAADPVTYYYVLNLQGDVVGLVDENGVYVAQYTYNAWGEILDISGDMAAINPLRYRGYYYDTETGFYYLQSRYYDPVNHRFINADNLASTAQGFLGYNMFAYCLNNPVNLFDSTGYESGTLAIWAGMAWLCGADGPIPVGDIIYVAGCLVCGVIDLINYFGADNVVFVANGAYDVYNSAKHGGGNFSTSMAGSTPATPPNRNNNNRGERDYVKAGGNAQANKWAQRAGADSAEALKEEFVGKSGSRFDMYIDRTTNELLLIGKTSGVIISTGYYLP